MKRKNKIILLMIILAVALSVFFFLIGGTLANIKFSEINTGTFVAPPPSQVSIQKAINQTSTANSVQNMLDSAGCKDNTGICSASSPKLLINTQVVMYDSNQVPYPYSTYINIPLQDLTGWNMFNAVDLHGNFIDKVKKLSLVDSQGHILDLGTIKLSMYAATNYDTNVIVSGDFAVYLDDQLRGQKHLAIQGMTQNKSIAMQINGQSAYGFTFANEGATWTNGTQHIFKILIGNVTGTVGTGQNTQTFRLTQNSLAYVLVMTLNSDKKTVLGIDNKAVTVYKSDDSILLSARNAVWGDYQTGCTVCNYGIQDNFFVSSGPTTASAKVYVNGFLIASGSIVGSSDQASSQGIVTSTVTGIPRDSDVIVITQDGSKYSFHTPIVQETYNLNCAGTVSNTDPVNGRGQYVNSGGCTNDFGLRN